MMLDDEDEEEEDDDDDDDADDHDDEDEEQDDDGDGDDDFRLSISNLAYSESGSPFPDCREGLTDRLSNSVLLPGIEPRTGRKRDAAISTELIPDPYDGDDEDNDDDDDDDG